MISPKQENSEHTAIAYGAALQLYIHEGGLVWSRFNIYLVANSIVIASMGLLNTVTTQNIFASLSLPVFGLCLCLIWYLLTLRGFIRCGHYHKLVWEMEKRLFNDELHVMRKIEDLEGKGNLFGSVNYRNAALITIALFAIPYAVSLMCKLSFLMCLR